MRPRGTFPVRPFDAPPATVIDAAKRIFTLRGELNGTEPVPLDRYRCASARLDGHTVVASRYPSSTVFRGECQPERP